MYAEATVMWLGHTWKTAHPKLFMFLKIAKSSLKDATLNGSGSASICREESCRDVLIPDQQNTISQSEQ